MARPRIYKDAQEAKQAENARKARYKTENSESIQAWLPKGYKEKLNICAERMNISKAQVLKMCIDTLYNELESKEGKKAKPG